MNTSRTYTLLIIFLALAGWYLWQKNEATNNPGSEVPTQEVVPTLEYLFPANQGLVTSILIENSDGKSVAFERVGAGWRVTLPIFSEADSGAVEAAASQLTALLVQTRLPNLDPAEAGLTSPRFTLTVGFSDGSFRIAFVGDETPTGGAYYVRKDDGSIVVIGARGLDALTGMIENLPVPPSAIPSASPTSAPVTETLQPTATLEAVTATKSP